MDGGVASRIRHLSASASFRVLDSTHLPSVQSAMAMAREKRNIAATWTRQGRGRHSSSRQNFSTTNRKLLLVLAQLLLQILSRSSIGAIDASRSQNSTMGELGRCVSDRFGDCLASCGLKKFW